MSVLRPAGRHPFHRVLRDGELERSSSGGRGRQGRRRSEAGSAMILVPAAVLVLVVLASIALDSAAVFLGQRQLAEAAASAATDAAGAISESSFYRSGTIALDPAEAQSIAAASVAAQDLHGVNLTEPVQVTVVGRQVCVSLSAEVPLIVGRALPDVPRDIGVHATATASAAGDHGATVPTSAVC